MATFDQLIDDVRQHLHNFLEDEEQYATLVGNIAAGDLSITVDDATHVDAGAIEIEDEIILIKSVDKTTNILSVRVRGYDSTTPAAHSNGALIRVQPLFPRQKIKDMINDTIRGTYPTLFQVKPAPLITYTATTQMYSLPADVGEVLTVKYSVPGGMPWWQPAASWELDDNANKEAGAGAVFATGKALWLGDAPVSGQAIQVVYLAAPGALSAGTDTLETTSGLPAGTRDLIALGTVARMIPPVEVGRLAHGSIEQSVRDQVVRPADAIATSRYYWQLYSARLEEEGKKLQDLNRLATRRTF